MALTVAAAQDFMTKYGDRVCIFAIDNQKMLFINYAGGDVKKEDISFQTINDCDMMIIHHHDMNKHVTYTTYYILEVLQAIYVLDEGCQEFRIDPIHC